MRIIETKDYNDMSKKAANILSAQVIMKPDCVLGTASILLKISSPPTIGIKIRYLALPIPCERFLFIMLIRFFRCSILKLLDKEVADLFVWDSPNRWY